VGPLILNLVPLALGVVLSPLAIMALVAVLLSRLRRVNGIAYLLGWILGLGGLLALFLWIFALIDVQQPGTPALWVPIVRILLGLLLVAVAVWVYRRGAVAIQRMAAVSTPREIAAAAPQLPGWLQAVSTFRPVRTFFLGLGLFVVNPVDASCAILAALDISLAGVTPSQTAWTAIVFTIVGALPIGIPVFIVLARGEGAQPMLDRVRAWIAGNTHVLNAGLLLVIGALQLEKGIAGLL
jgi:hypothetical protein